MDSNSDALNFYLNNDFNKKKILNFLGCIIFIRMKLLFHW